MPTADDYAEFGRGIIPESAYSKPEPLRRVKAEERWETPSFAYEVTHMPKGTRVNVVCVKEHPDTAIRGSRMVNLTLQELIILHAELTEIIVHLKNAPTLDSPLETPSTAAVPKRR
jgi:hypothetical protein